MLCNFYIGLWKGWEVLVRNVNEMGISMLRIESIYKYFSNGIV